MELQLHKKISFIWVVCILVFGAWKLLIVLSQIPSAQLMGSCGCSPTALNLKPRLQLCFVTDFLMSTSSAHELPTASKDLFASLYSWNKSYQCNYCRVMENLLNSLLKGEIQSSLYVSLCDWKYMELDINHLRDMNRWRTNKNSFSIVINWCKFRQYFISNFLSTMR